MFQLGYFSKCCPLIRPDSELSAVAKTGRDNLIGSIGGAGIARLTGEPISIKAVLEGGNFAVQRIILILMLSSYTVNQLLEKKHQAGTLSPAPKLIQMKTAAATLTFVNLATMSLMLSLPSKRHREKKKKNTSDEADIRPIIIVSIHAEERDQYGR